MKVKRLASAVLLAIGMLGIWGCGSDTPSSANPDQLTFAQLPGRA